MLFETVLIGVVGVWFFRKNTASELVLPVGITWVFASVIVELLASYLIKTKWHDTLLGMTYWISLIGYGLLLVFIILNLKRYWGMWLCYLGTLLNMLVIFLNKGRMPVTITWAEQAGFTETVEALQSGMVFGHQVLNKAHVLRGLSDIWNLGPSYPFPKTFSVGDVILDLGILLICWQIARRE